MSRNVCGKLNRLTIVLAVVGLLGSVGLFGTYLEAEGTVTSKVEKRENIVPYPGHVESMPGLTVSDIPQASPKSNLRDDYKFEFKSSPGLTTDILIFPSGAKLIINFPNDIAVGDTFSGTLQTEAPGKDDGQRARNQAELEKAVLLIGGQQVRATENVFTRTIPQQINAAEPLVILKVNGREVASVQVSISQTPTPQPATTQLPTCGQMGKNVVVMDHCDGIIAPNDSCSIAGTPLQPLAESLRMRVLQNTSNTPGATQINYSEQGKPTSGPFQNLGVGLSAGNLSLLRGQQTTLVVTVTGLAGIQQDVPLDLINESPAVINMEGGNAQHVSIHRADVAADGSYKVQRTLTGIQPGAFQIRATVVCEPPGQPPPMPEPTPTKSPFPTTGERPSPHPPTVSQPPDRPEPTPTPTLPPNPQPKQCVLTATPLPGKAIDGDAYAPLADPISKSNESIPLIVTAFDNDQLLQGCYCPPGEIESKAIPIVDSVNYSWTAPPNRFLGTLDAGGPASLYKPPDILVGLKVEAVVLVDVTDSGENGKDEAKQVKFTITIERQNVCRYKREVKIEKNFGGDKSVEPEGQNECKPAEEHWDPKPKLKGETDKDSIKLCAGEQILLHASGADTDTLELQCVSSNCDSPPKKSVPIVDEMKYKWKVTGPSMSPSPSKTSSGFVDKDGKGATEAETNSRKTSVIFRGAEPGKYTVMIDIEDSGRQGKDLPPIHKEMKIDVYRVKLEVEGSSRSETECEETSAGICLNKDDDNNNKKEDKDDAGVVGEDDLKKITLRKEPAEGTMTLKVSSDKVEIWSDKEKKTKPSSLTFDATKPQELWVEGVKPSVIEKDIELVLEADGPPCSDKVKLTVTKAVSPDLVIHNGQGGPAVLEAEEETIGAFTLANLNDTDGDGTIDKNDAEVKATANGRDEVDLIEVTIQKPKDDMGGTVKLTMTGDGTKTKLWKKATKATLETKREWAISELPQTLWLEGRDKSAALRDVELKLQYMGCEDRARVTFVWAEETAVKHNDGDVLWADFGFPPQKWTDMFGVAGLRPINATNGVRNSIAIQFTVYPAGVGKEPGVSFDISRQVEDKFWAKTGATTIELPGSEIFPVQNEEPNDDTGDSDESTQPTADDHMYSVDGPGVGSEVAFADLVVWRLNFLEFIRVRFDATRPSGETVDGSQGSDKFKWHVRHRWIKAASGDWVRPGSPPETENNDVAPGHIEIGKDPS